VVEQAPQGGGCDAKLALDLRQGPRLGEHPIHQVGPHALNAQLGRLVGGALVGGALTLPGELLAARWLIR